MKPLVQLLYVVDEAFKEKYPSSQRYMRTLPYKQSYVMGSCVTQSYPLANPRAAALPAIRLAGAG